MTIEKQVCSLELAKRLKELAVKQESLFAWKDIGEYQVIISQEPSLIKGKILASAFTVAELGEMLSWAIEGKLLCISKDVKGGWVVFYEDNVIGGIINKELRIYDQVADTEADARAKMLIYLVENKLVTL